METTAKEKATAGLKPIPSALTKKKAYEIFNQLPTSYVRRTIHWIQVELEQNPEVSSEECKRRHRLNSREVYRLFKELGSPAGYEPHPEI